MLHRDRIPLGRLLPVVLVVIGCGGAGGDGSGPPEPVATIVVSPPSSTVEAGQSVTLAAELKDAGGRVLTGRTVTWASGTPSVATVNSAGVVSGVDSGTATITASSEGRSGTGTVTVTLPAPVIASVRLDSLPTTMAPGDSVQLTADARDASGAILPGITLAWNSTDTAVVLVTSTGLAIARSAGEAIVSASAGGSTAQTMSTVLVTYANLWSAYGHTCALSSPGVAYCWGANNDFQLGDPSVTSSDAPRRVQTSLRFSALAVAGNGVTGHTCGIALNTQALYCWGGNENGQLGNGGTTPALTPTPVAGGLQFVDVTAGPYFTCATTTAHEAYCWGANSRGQLGDGSTSPHSTPAAVNGGIAFATISAGFLHTCGVSTDSLAYCWGENTLYGRLGTGDNLDRTAPALVAGGILFATVSAGPSETCGVAIDGTPYCWGFNAGGQLGDGTQTNRNVPTPVTGGISMATITAGGGSTCGVSLSGVGYCWGPTWIGSAVSGITTSPVAISGNLQFTNLSAGINGVCGMAGGPTAWCWGSDDTGQQGNGPAPGTVTPDRVKFQP